MINRAILASDLKADPFPFRSEGDITLAVRNADYSLGPVMAHIVMKPGSVIPAHLHEGLAEALYVVEGDFINEGKPYSPGTSLHNKAGNLHGPHTTENGCAVLVLWIDGAMTKAPNLGDFIFPEKNS